MEEVELHAGHLPKRSTKSRPFWYVQDLSIFVWGELVGFSLLSFVVGYVYRPSHAPLVLVATFIGLLLTLLLHTLIMSTHRVANSHYPKEGELSWNGVLHIGYFFWQLSFAAYLFLLLSVGRLFGELLALTVIGYLVYLACLVLDLKRSMLALRKK